MLRRLLIAVFPVLAVVLSIGGPVGAHNTLLSSDPKDGAVVAVAPGQLRLLFDVAVPLETLTVEYIDASSVRSDLAGFTHGVSGATEVIVPLPLLPAGEVALRWRLVGPDGHPIRGRVGFVVDAAVPAALPDEVPDASTRVGESGAMAEFSEPWNAPSALRWALRYVSYLAIMALGGVAVTTGLVWRHAWSHVSVRRVAWGSIFVAGVAGLVQLLIVASDISGRPVWSAWNGVGPAFGTDAGAAFVVRLVLLAGLGAVLAGAVPIRERLRWVWASGAVLALLGTWAYAGHAKSMRLGVIGVPLDVAHHGAAAAWIGGLALISLVAIRSCDADEMVEVVQRFAKVAAISVATIVATGAFQAVRLVGHPVDLIVTGHGRYLLAKLVVLAFMLKVADVNRRRVAARFQSVSTVTPLVVDNLGRAMATEFCVGLVVIAITAAMVVSPPSVAAAVGLWVR